MRNMLLLWLYLWEGLPTLLAFPIDSFDNLGTRSTLYSRWEDHWPRYLIGALGLIVVGFTLAGCLCCRRQRRPKGFQDDAGNGKEFKDGSTAGTETTIERNTSTSLELEVPRIASSLDKVQFESLPIDRIGVDNRPSSKPKPPSPSLFSDERELEKNLLRDQPCREWYERGSVHVPREKLKYLREIGRGWFGKVVEGTTIEDGESGSKNRGVVVRILTEEATTREKAWFLGEATPYLKLRHENILTLLGSCLETDPYLLLFESCPAGDLKGFLRSNRDKGTCEALRRENVPTRMALDIANALEHMHDNGFAHTDLSARNCLVAQDLSIKLGDYGTGVEKYPGDYYVVGDRALPIRWSAPESLDCTATTIETRAITPRANLWSYGVLLWEMATWGERPYDDLGDEQVIEMIFSLKTGVSPSGIATLRKLRVDEIDVAQNFCDAIESSRKFFPNERSSLSETREIICGKRIEDFESRWENLRPNGTSDNNRSASLDDLRTSLVNEIFNEEGNSKVVQAQFRLGPDEPVKNVPSSRPSGQESGSETEEESWRGRVERGAYTEKVKQKSKSVADLMVLVHIDSDSDAEISLGPQNGEKTSKKRLPASGSDGDLRSTVLADEFDEAIRKLREPSICNGAIPKVGKNHQEIVREMDINEKPKLLTLTQQGETSILRLSLGTPENFSSSRIIEKIDDRGKNHFSEIVSECDDKLQFPNEKLDDEKKNLTIEMSSTAKTESPHVEAHVLRLVSKGEPEFPLLRYVPEGTSTPEKSVVDSFLPYETRNPSNDSSKEITNSPTNAVSSLDVDLWNNALARELEKKNPRYDVGATDFNNFDSSTIVDYVTNPNDTESVCDCPRDNLEKSSTVPNTPDKRKNSPIQLFSAPETPQYYRRDNSNEDSSSDLTLGGIHTGVCCRPREKSEKSSTVPNTPDRRRNSPIQLFSAPPTPRYYSRDEVSSTGEELESGVMKRLSHEAEDEEDRKLLSTPDDERSSDSGFRDKESCEEEESPIPCNAASNIIISNTISSENATNSSPFSASAEEEQMRILFELDTILDAEYYGSFNDSDRLDDSDALSPSDVRVHFDDSDDIIGKNRSFSESLESEESTDVVETVRANSCEPDFLDTRSTREIVDDTELRKIGNLLKNEGKEETKNSLEICDSTEADSISSECSMKVEKNSSVETTVENRANPQQSSADLAIEQRRSNVDSSDLREKIEIESSISTNLHDDREKNESPSVSDLVDLAESSSESPIKIDKNSGADNSLDFISPCDISEIGKISEIKSSDSTSQSELKTDKKSDDLDKPNVSESLTNDSIKTDRKSDNFETSAGDASEIYEATENSTSDSPLKTDRCQTSDVSMETRPGIDSSHMDVEQWSSRENVNDPENDDEDSSTMSLRSDNSYVSFGLDEEFVAAIRNELREKLPHAQMPVIETLDPRDEKEPSINVDAESKRWEDEESDENSERGSGGVDISIRYNIYGTPLSPIMEERESAGTSESLVSKEDSRDASIASRVSALSEDVLVVDTRTNRAMMLEGTTGNGESSNLQQDDDRDTSHGDFSDEENLEYPQNNLNRGMENKRITMGSGGAPLPSPEEETKWQQQFPLPLQMQDDLMSTSFGTDRDWDSQDDDEGEDDGDDGEEDEEENSSSSGEFVWKRYDESHGDLENVATRSPPNKPKSQEPDADLEEDDEGGEDDDEEEEEFTPSAWDASLAPHRSALRSPEKTLKSGDQKKSVWFKKQRYHCVYEYPKESPMAGSQGQTATTWEPTSYADWEEMMDEPRLDVYPMEYDETNRAGDEEFYVSSSNRPFQFQSGEGKYVSQFFPGASSTLLQQQQQQEQQQQNQHQLASREADDALESQDEVDHVEIPLQQIVPTLDNGRSLEIVENQQQAQQTQLGELRHTRDRLKLNLLSTSGAAKTDEDIGNENRFSSTDKNENTNEEILGIPRRKSDALEIDEISNETKKSSMKEKTLIDEDFVEKTSKTPEATNEEKKSESDGSEIVEKSSETPKKSTVLSAEEKSLELKITKTEIDADFTRKIEKSSDDNLEENILLEAKASAIEIGNDSSKETTRSSQEENNDEKSSELKIPETKIVADSPRKIEKASKEKSEEKQIDEFLTIGESSQEKNDEEKSSELKIPETKIFADSPRKIEKASKEKSEEKQIDEFSTIGESSQEKNDEEKSSELKIPETKIVADSPRKIEKSSKEKSEEKQIDEFFTIGESSQEKNDEEKSSELKIPETKIVADSPRKIEKSSKEKSEEKQIDEFLTIGESSQEKNDEEKPSELKIPETKIVADSPRKFEKSSKEKSEEKQIDEFLTIGESSQEKNDEEKSSELKILETKIVADSPRKIEKSQEKSEEKQIDEILTIDESSKIGKRSLPIKDEKSIVSIPRDEENLAVRISSKGSDNKIVIEDKTKPLEALMSDDLTVIQNKCEFNDTNDISSSGNDSRTIGDQKGSSSLMSQIDLEKIVDITKLVTDDNLTNAQQHIESHELNSEKSETTENASISRVDAQSTNEKIKDVLSSQS